MPGSPPGPFHTFWKTLLQDLTPQDAICQALFKGALPACWEAGGRVPDNPCALLLHGHGSHIWALPGSGCPCLWQPPHSNPDSCTALSLCCLSSCFLTGDVDKAVNGVSEGQGKFGETWQLLDEVAPKHPLPGVPKAASLGAHLCSLLHSMDFGISQGFVFYPAQENRTAEPP